MYQAMETAVRRAPLQGFSYSVLYRILPEWIEVIGVVHQSRDPIANTAYGVSVWAWFVLECYASSPHAYGDRDPAREYRRALKYSAACPRASSIGLWVCGTSRSSSGG